MLTLVNRSELGRRQWRRESGACHVRLVAVELLVDLLHGDGGRDVVGVDADAHLARDALPGRVRWLRDTSFGCKRLGRRLREVVLLLLLLLVRRRVLLSLL